MAPEAGIPLGELAEKLGAELSGDAGYRVAGVAPLERAGPGDLSFLSGRAYLEAMRASAAEALIIPRQLATVAGLPSNTLSVEDPHAALAAALELLYPTPEIRWGIHPTARLGKGCSWSGRIALGPGARIGEGSTLGSDCVIGDGGVIEEDVVVGDACVLESHSTVHSGARLGNRVRVRSGARVGGSGFGYYQSGSRHLPVRHVGGCIVEDDVDIGANTTVDRGSVSDTVVGEGSKLDNLVQIGHNVRIGNNCLIMAQAGLAGSTIIEDEVLIAGQAGLAGHLRVGRRARLAAQSGVIGDVAAGDTVSGYPARSHREVLRQAAALRKLPDLIKRIHRMGEPDG